MGVVLVLDSSGSLTDEGFAVMKEVAAKITETGSDTHDRTDEILLEEETISS